MFVDARVGRSARAVCLGRTLVTCRWSNGDVVIDGLDSMNDMLAEWVSASELYVYARSGRVVRCTPAPRAAPGVRIGLFLVPEAAPRLDEMPTLAEAKAAGDPQDRCR